MNNLKHLAKAIKGQVSFDPLVQKYYSVDASMYEVRPKVIVFPKNEADVIATVRFAKKHKIGITPRGAGTGLVGGALGDQIILDLKHINHIRIGRNSVTVGPGTIKGILDEQLAGRRKFLAPNPSVGKYCTIGGMVATNASGSHALKYGSVIDNILSVTFIDGMGQKIHLDSKHKKAHQILDIAKNIDSAKFPRVTKNSCGYRLDKIKKLSDAYKIIAGSEGTLGIVTSVRFKIRDIPNKKRLVVFSYKNYQSISKDVKLILKSSPAAIEFVDANTIKNIPFNFSSGTKSALFVEWDEPSRIQNIQGVKEYETANLHTIQKWWQYRNSALTFSIRTAKDALVPHIIEDAAVPIKNLGNLFELIADLNERFKSHTILYGHAGDANLHIRLIGKYTRGQLRQLSRMFFGEVLKIGGTITAEHGDGLARSEFVKMQYGTHNYELFKSLKKAFDPYGILNPGKIVK